MPLHKEVAALGNEKTFDPSVTWPSIRAQVAALHVPDERLQFLYDAAVHTLVLLSADEIVPGPYTYRRFWFRDACLMMNALLAIGLTGRCRRAIEQFPARQLHNGYFRSQEGEWDSNGQVLWILDRYVALTGEPLPDSAARRRRAKPSPGSTASASATTPTRCTRACLPAGFSAEHLGPNDYYYWDDFWAEAGLRAAARIYARRGRRREADAARDEGRRPAARRSTAACNRIPAWRSLGRHSRLALSPHRRRRRRLARRRLPAAALSARRAADHGHGRSPAAAAASSAAASFKT